MDTESITELASIIAENTAVVSAYLTANGLPQPSFAATGPTTSQIPQEAVNIESARLTVIDASKRLRNLLLGPHDYLISFMPNEMLSLQAIARFGIASCVPIDGTASFATIAAYCGLPESTVRRLLRHAIVKNVFRETDRGQVAHNAVSRLLADKPVLNEWLRTSTDEGWTAAAHTVDALAKWPGSEEPDETGFVLANGTDKAIYDFFQEHPERGQRFAAAMTNLTQSPGYDSAHLVAGFDWASLQSGVVVDVGGSHGSVARRLAASFPALKVVVQDLPDIIAQAPATDARVSFMVHDFFKPQPVVADVYILRWILHNWPDKYCVRILRALLPALKAGARVVVNEHVLPPSVGGGSQWKEERLRGADLTMLQLFNSRERELEDWEALFEMADPRFRFVGVRKPEGSTLSVLEAVWEP